MLAENLRERRLAMGLTQAGLSDRSAVSLPTLRKFEQTGLISLESFLKLLTVLGGLDDLVAATAPPQNTYTSIDEVLSDKPPRKRQRGWRK